MTISQEHAVAEFRRQASMFMRVVLTSSQHARLSELTGTYGDCYWDAKTGNHIFHSDGARAYLDKIAEAIGNQVAEQLTGSTK